MDHLELTHFQLLSALCGFLLFIAGLVAGFGKLLLAAYERRMLEKFADLEVLRQQATQHWNDRFSDIKASISTLNGTLQDVDQEFTTLHQNLTDNYIRREDWIRLCANYDHKLESLAARLERCQEVHCHL